MNHRSIRIYTIVAAIIFVQFCFLAFGRNEKAEERPLNYIVEAKQAEIWPAKVIGDPVALFTLVLTAFTGGLFFATRNLWIATKDLVSGAEVATALQSRAYVSIVGGAVFLVPHSFDGYTVQVSFKNSGSTPAYRFLTRIEGNIFLFDEIPFRDVPPNNKNQSSILGPGDAFHINTPPAIISSEDLNLVRSNDKAILIWGSAEYSDIFGKRFCFRYRCRMSGHEGTFPDGQVGWLLQPHPVGYDEELHSSASNV